MTLNEIVQIRKTLSSYSDFTAHNGDGDESGIVEDMFTQHQVSLSILDKEENRLIARNAKARAMRMAGKFSLK